MEPTLLAFDDSFRVPAPPERVFALLCPVREHDWLASWRCELLHAPTGIAGLDCTFRTGADGPVPMTWIVSRYEPPHRIEFTCFVAEVFVMRLDIEVAPDPAGARLDWSRRLIALGPAGAQALAQRTAQSHRSRMEGIERSLVHYLRTGKMLAPEG